jgi:signal transduction histidine kinase
MHVDAAADEQVRREAELREANEKLVLAVLSAQAVQAAAEDAQRRQVEFIAMLAHELRNPLAPMRNVSAMLARVEADDPILPRLQTIIERQVVHMARLVDDLLDVSRAHTGKLRLERSVVLLSVVIAESIEASRPAMDVRLQHFSLTLPSRALSVDGDPMRLTQILTNLLDNASKYTPKEGEISLALSEADGCAVIVVSDSGIGIPAESLPGVFALFAQAPDAVHYNRLGLGIGLNVVQELVLAHGGSVIARSAGKGQGSQFIVTLPLVPTRPSLDPG